jgi:hypothetical protein
LIAIKDIENGHNIIGRCGRVEWGSVVRGRERQGMIDDGRWTREEGRGKLKVKNKNAKLMNRCAMAFIIS